MCVNVEKTQILHCRPQRYKRTKANFKRGRHTTCTCTCSKLFIESLFVTVYLTSSQA